MRCCPYDAGLIEFFSPIAELSDAHGFVFPDNCLHYDLAIAGWELAVGELSIPAPPQDAFGVLTNAAADGSSTSRRLLSDSVTSTLVLNGQEVSSVPVTYDADAGPQLLSVTPSIISAAVPEVWPFGKPMHHSHFIVLPLNLRL